MPPDRRYGSGPGPRNRNASTFRAENPRLQRGARALRRCAECRVTFERYRIGSLFPASVSASLPEARVGSGGARAVPIRGALTPGRGLADQSEAGRTAYFTPRGADPCARYITAASWRAPAKVCAGALRRTTAPDRREVGVKALSDIRLHGKLHAGLHAPLHALPYGFNGPDRPQRRARRSPFSPADRR